MNRFPLKYNPKNLASDLTAGVTTALVTIPVDAIFLVEDKLGLSTRETIRAAHAWLDGETEQTRQSEFRSTN